MRLGEPGIWLADAAEVPVLKLELAQNAGIFKVWTTPEAFKVSIGANDKLPDATIQVGLVDDPTLSANGRLRDWQVRDPWTLAAQNPDELRGRRVRLQTNRGALADEWLIFEGFIDRAELGWGAPARSLKLFCSCTVVAADREPSQQIWGQWRRSRASTLAILGGGQLTPEKLVHVGAMPTIFNPKGVPNCDPVPVPLTDGTTVYVFADADKDRAVPWTVAKMLRYLQFCAVQSAAPEPQTGVRYDLTWHPQLAGVRETDWLPGRNLSFGNIGTVLKTKLGGGVHDPTVLDAPPDGGTGPFGRAALLRAHASVSIETFSVLEALVHVAERSGIVVYVKQRFDNQGTAHTALNLAIRGWREAETVAVRGVTVPSDYVRLDGGHPYDTLSQVERVRLTSAVAGSLLIDRSGQRSSVRDVGDAVQYELTALLRPGWKPDAWWDIDPNNAAAVSEALARLATQPWLERYVMGALASVGSYGLVGRLWVLNEDGAFRGVDYQRQYGPWSTSGLSGQQWWDPFDFRVECGLKDLEVRGGNGWSARRRKFLPCIARDVAPPPSNVNSGGRDLGVLVEMSFDGGATWRLRPCSAQVLDDRCAIYVTNQDLRSIVPADPPRSDEEPNYVQAYLKGKLRVRVTANVEGDDAAYGLAPEWSTPDPSIGKAQQVRSRRGAVRHVRRDKANSVVQPLFTWPPGRDDSTEADAHAFRHRNELARRRVSGSFVVPYLLRGRDWFPLKDQGTAPADPPWPIYTVGDEIDTVDTGPDPSTDEVTPTALQLGQGAGSDRSGPRVVAIEYDYDAERGAMSTRVQLEDDVYKVPDAISAGEGIA